ncbi:MAG: hypothetical protein Kow001_11700 [Acidobacteriota bacterium]
MNRLESRNPRDPRDPRDSRDPRNPRDPRLRTLCLALAGLLLPSVPPALAADNGTTPACLVISGLGGVPEWEENFEKWADTAAGICRDQLKAAVFRLDGRTQVKAQILQTVTEAATAGNGDLWIFLVGHGTWDGREYRFNIKGPDLTTADLAEALDRLGDRRILVVAATSAAGGLLQRLGGPHRVILAATRERERHPPLFLSFFLEGLTSAEADRNKDRRVSLQEVFDFCELKVAAWYEEQGRIRTEHAGLNDAGGTGRLAPVTFLSAPPEQAYRSLEARELAPTRSRLEREIEDLKLRKTEMPADAYYRELERLLVELAELNERIRTLEGEP